jgi:TonB family protein
MGRIRILFVVMALFAALFIQTCMAQPQGHAERKVVSTIVPFYPEIAKRNRIKGMVKLEVVVRKNGSVQSTKVLGGGPVLIESAADAVRKWKFEPAAEETTEVIQFVFDNEHSASTSEKTPTFFSDEVYI